MSMVSVLDQIQAKKKSVGARKLAKRASHEVVTYSKTNPNRTAVKKIMLEAEETKEAKTKAPRKRSPSCVDKTKKSIESSTKRLLS